MSQSNKKISNLKYMSSYKLLIVGRFCNNQHLGSMFGRACTTLNLSFLIFDLDLLSTSMNYIYGKLFYRLSGKKTLEWWKINEKLRLTLVEQRPSHVIVTGLYPLQKKIFHTASILGIRMINYLTDSPWNRANGSIAFFYNIRMYDIICSTKMSIINKLNAAGAKKVFFVPFAFDPYQHAIVDAIPLQDSPFFTDVSLVGGADKERILLMKDFKKRFHGNLKLYGSYWDRCSELKYYHSGSVFGVDLCRTYRYSSINIGLVRRANGDGHSMRTYEIPACGGVAIYEDTEEHRMIFSTYPDHGFFQTGYDLADKCNFLIKNTEELERMRRIGMETIVGGSNTYGDRIIEIIKLCDSVF